MGLHWGDGVSDDRPRMRAAALAAAIVGAAQGHGSLTYPPPRNNFGRVDPANRSIGNPVHGKWAHLPPSHINMGPCAGGACLWFSEGCFIGCEECTATMPTGGNQIDHPPAGCKPLAPTLPEAFRTYNLKNLSANGDWTATHPWRAPGRAPISDPCGVAGAYTVATGGGGETPPGSKQGDKGSALPEGESTTCVQQLCSSQLSHKV